MNGQLYVGYQGYIMSYPVKGGKFVDIAAVKDFEWDNENWILTSTTENMVKDFEGWGSDIIDLIQRFEMKDKWGFFDMAHDQKYYRGNICLMGDSALASTPHLGAGAGMAFEDAYILSYLLGMAEDCGEVEKVFACFDGSRRKRSQEVIKMSRKAGRANVMEGEGIGDDFELVKADIDARYRWIRDFDLEGELAEAMQHSGWYEGWETKLGVNF